MGLGHEGFSPEVVQQPGVGDGPLVNDLGQMLVSL